ncbi:MULTISPECIES: TIGR02450 family Trp-rich protein [Pseudomonadati]|uniref:TIGR02450 family Trp-rich protein n=1 Tax=Shewanella aestuarii TaxID=1028752 RepID=A0ABT0L5Z1_9GAMM|nr:TIGR02450 family Trp-rich protein [Shewanella aestuarii]MCL1118636.1 TIGR02450 family Trp-rich protein [Shewanella aestuarii]GGN83482.1 hypothetical protein GCM10009193_31750 [Shewanella aestuarii]
MNKINLAKLLNSKWTAVKPTYKEKHFLVTDIEFDENNVVINCEIEAIMSKRITAIDWQQLTDSQLWIQGWK